MCLVLLSVGHRLLLVLLLRCFHYLGVELRHRRVHDVLLGYLELNFLGAGFAVSGVGQLGEEEEVVVLLFVLVDDELVVLSLVAAWVDLRCGTKAIPLSWSWAFLAGQ